MHQVFFLHAFYTDYMDYCIGRIFGASLFFILIVIALKLVVQVVFILFFCFSLSLFSRQMFVLILSIFEIAVICLLSTKSSYLYNF